MRDRWWRSRGVGRFIFLCFWTPSQGQVAATVDKIVARIGQRIVLLSEVKSEHQSLLASGVEAEECEVLESLVVNRMLLAEAAAASVEVGEEEVNNEINRRFEVLLEQFGSQQVVEDLYEKSIYQLKEELREEVKNGMTTQRMVQQLGDEVQVSPLEVREFYERLADEEIPYLSTQVRIAQIVRVPRPSREREQEVSALLRQVRDEIMQGASFEEMAREYSMDPSVVQNGGTLGFFSIGQLAPEYEATALRLSPGVISKPVRSSFGYHIIELLEKRGGKYNSRHILRTVRPAPEDVAAVEQELQALRTRIVQDELSFEEAAIAHSEDEVTRYGGGYLVGADNAQYLSVEALNPLLFFTLDTLAVGDITPPLSYRQDGKSALRIIYYKGKIQAHRANLRQDYTRFEETCLRKKRETYMKKWAVAAKEKLYVRVDAPYQDCVVLR